MDDREANMGDSGDAEDRVRESLEIVLVKEEEEEAVAEELPTTEVVVVVAAKVLGMVRMYEVEATGVVFEAVASRRSGRKGDSRGILDQTRRNVCTSVSVVCVKVVNDDGDGDDGIKMSKWERGWRQGRKDFLLLLLANFFRT